MYAKLFKCMERYSNACNNIQIHLNLIESNKIKGCNDGFQ